MEFDLCLTPVVWQLRKDSQQIHFLSQEKVKYYSQTVSNSSTDEPSEDYVRLFDGFSRLLTSLL